MTTIALPRINPVLVAEVSDQTGSLPAGTTFVPSSTSSFGPNASLQLANATLSISDGDVYFSGKKVGTCNDNGDYLCTFGG